MKFPDSLGKSGEWLDLFNASRHYVDSRFKSEMEVELALPKRARFLTSQKKVTNEGHGIERFKKFESLLESGFSWGRHHFERMFHGISSISLARTLFGDEEWASYGSDLAQERGWSLISQMAIGTAPRRFGKSVSIAKVAAALAYCLLVHHDGLTITEYNVTIFSTGKRASKLLSDYVRKFLEELGLFDKFYALPDNSECITLHGDNMQVIFMFVPANPTTYVFF